MFVGDRTRRARVQGVCSIWSQILCHWHYFLFDSKSPRSYYLLLSSSQMPFFLIFGGFPSFLPFLSEKTDCSVLSDIGRGFQTAEPKREVVCDLKIILKSRTECIRACMRVCFPLRTCPGWKVLYPHMRKLPLVKLGWSPATFCLGVEVSQGNTEGHWHEVIRVPAVECEICYYCECLKCSSCFK